MIWLVTKLTKNKIVSLKINFLCVTMPRFSLSLYFRKNTNDFMKIIFFKKNWSEENEES